MRENKKSRSGLHMAAHTPLSGNNSCDIKKHNNTDKGLVCKKLQYGHMHCMHTKWGYKKLPELLDEHVSRVQWETIFLEGNGLPEQLKRQFMSGVRG